MSVALLDVNVLVAMAWPNHIHHCAASDWFERHHGDGWATCSFTQTGFVRVSSNARVVPGARRPAEAIHLLRELTALSGHQFWVDDIALAKSEFVDTDRIIGHRQITDAHLVALSLRHCGKLVTFDAGIAEVVPAGIDRDAQLAILRG